MIFWEIFLWGVRQDSQDFTRLKYPENPVNPVKINPQNKAQTPPAHILAQATTDPLSDPLPMT